MLDTASQARFDALRQRWFPPERNFLQAHVTLFHALPEAAIDAVPEGLNEWCRRQRPAGFATCGLRFLGRGVAYELSMPAIVALRAELAAFWRGWLTAQDRQAFRPHITVQNKVTPMAARLLLAELQAADAPWRGEVPGFALWRYEGGPWSHVRDLKFEGGAAG